MSALSGPPAARRRRRTRGYLLLEQMVAGGILAAALATTYGVMAQAQNAIIRSGKRQLAISVAKAQAEQLATAPHVLVGTTAFTVPGESAMSGTYKVEQAALEGSSTPNLRSADTLHEIIVTVTYPSVDGTPTTLTYRQFRRKR